MANNRSASGNWRYMYTPSTDRKRGGGGGGSRREREYWAEIQRNAQQAQSRPVGELEAGNTLVDGHPAYYEDGGQSGVSNQRDLYTGPNGPFGPDHTHRVSQDGGETWRQAEK